MKNLILLFAPFILLACDISRAADAEQLNVPQTQYEKAIIDLEDLLLGHGYSLNGTTSMPADILKMVHI